MLRSNAKKKAARCQYRPDVANDNLTGSIRILAVALLDGDILDESFKLLVVDVVGRPFRDLVGG